MIGQPSRDAECKACGAPFIRYNTIQALCRDCSLARQKKIQEKARIGTSLRKSVELQGQARPGTPLKTISSRKPIKQQGKKHREWILFRDKILRPYLDNKFGILCFDCHVLPAQKEDGTYYRHDCDHVQGRGAHAELRLVVTNFVYRCRPCHIQKTGVPQWTKKAA